MSKAGISEMWPNGKRRRWLGGRTSIGVLEYIVTVLTEDGDTPAFDIFIELHNIGIECSIQYVRNATSMAKTIILELQREKMLKRNILPDKN